MVVSESRFVCYAAESWGRRAMGVLGHRKSDLLQLPHFDACFLLPLYNGRLFIKVGCIETVSSTAIPPQFGGLPL